MKVSFVSLALIALTTMVQAQTKKQVIREGERIHASCPEYGTSYIFCGTDAYDVPGICGHKFECALMKFDEKKMICQVEYTCEQKLPLQTEEQSEKKSR